MANASGSCKENGMDFYGAKLAILVGDHVVTLLRDDTPGLAFANYWDLPGGEREGNETPAQCVLRELHEELGLVLQEGDLHHGFECKSDNRTVWFFVSKPADFDPSAVVLGNEGQGWKLAPIDWFLAEARAIPVLVSRLRGYLERGHPCA